MSYQLGLYEKAMPPLSLKEELQVAEQAGFDWLEISIDETDEKLERLSCRYETIAELKRLSGCRVLTMCLSAHRRFPLGSQNAETRKKALEIFRQAVFFSVEASIRFIQLAGYDVYYEDSGEDTRKWFEENLVRCADIAAEYGVLIGFETMETPFMDTVQKAMRYVHEINSPYLGLYPDVGNLTNASVLYDFDVCDDLAFGRGHILAAHLKETLPGIYRDLSFGQGHTDYIPAIKTLYEMGVRMFTGEFWHQGERNWRQRISSAAVFLRGQIECAIMQLGDKS